jgi:hypothetical protein
MEKLETSNLPQASCGPAYWLQIIWQRHQLKPLYFLELGCLNFSTNQPRGRQIWNVTYLLVDGPIKTFSFFFFQKLVVRYWSLWTWSSSCCSVLVQENTEWWKDPTVIITPLESMFTPLNLLVPEFKLPLQFFLEVWPWTNLLSHLGFSLFICNVGIVTASTSKHFFTHRVYNTEGILSQLY